MGFDLGGIAAIGGAIAGPAMNLIGVDMANRANMHLANRAMSWQGNMANTAHQREVQDMIRAGLNPILSAGGNGASTPSPGQPTIQAPQVDVSPVFQALSFMQNQQRVDNETAATAATVDKSKSEVGLNAVKKDLLGKGMIRSQTEKMMWEWIQKTIKSLRGMQQRSAPPNGPGGIQNNSIPSITPSP